MNILIYLYTETYLYKKPDRQIIKEKLKKLVDIAKRRNRVDDIVNYDKEEKTVKQMTKLDKKRLGFTPEKGQNQWTRSCQNSGNDKKRRPGYYTSVEDILAQGFKLDKNTGIYEKQVTLQGKKGKKGKTVTIRAVGLQETNDDGTTKMVYYSCNPDENGDHMFVGFLSRSNNPYGLCMPCCFKKDPYLSKNKTKQEYYMKCIGKKQEVKEEKRGTKVVGDQLYILQDTNKIQEGRFGFLPKYLDYLFNQSLNNTRKIRHHYLIITDGYFFKYGSKQDEFPFFNAVGSLFDKSVSDIKNRLIDKLEKDKSNMIFTSINNGDIKTRFGTRERFIEYIKTSDQLTSDVFSHALGIPGIITTDGLNIVIYNKETIVIKKTLEKERVKDDFSILCQNIEESENILDPKRNTIFMIKENKNYYPIVLVVKKDPDSKNVKTQKVFKYENKDDNIVHHTSDFYIQNCKIQLFRDIRNKKVNVIAKVAYKIFSNLGSHRQMQSSSSTREDKEFSPRYQIIDARNKCKYFVLNNSLIVPVLPSGSIYNLAILKGTSGKVLSTEETIKKLNQLHDMTKGVLPIKPIGVYYTTKTKTTAHVIAIMIETYDNVPVKEENISIDTINKYGLVLENEQLYDKIDEEIAKGKDNYIVDDRIADVNYKNYYNESYELFRLEFSEYINKPENESLRNRIIKIVTGQNTKKDKKMELRQIIYKLVDKGLRKLYDSTLKQTGGHNFLGGARSRFVYIASKTPDVSNYQINNNRDVCETHGTKDACDKNPHCHWIYDDCYFSLTREMAINFVNKMTEELANNDVKAAEILRRGDYYVSDIVDYNRFTERKNQKIIKSTNTGIANALSKLFGKENIPKIGKRRSLKGEVVDIQEMNYENPMKDMGKFYVQNIIKNNLSLYRAYANGYSWIKHKYYDLSNRNLGYYNNLQTDLANYFRSMVIDWLTDKNNLKDAKENLVKYMDTTQSRDKDVAIIKDFASRISRDIITITDGIVEYYVLSKVYETPIIVYNNNNDVIYIFDDGMIYNMEEDGAKAFNERKYDKYRQDEVVLNSANIRYTLTPGSDVPIDIEILYFK